jgi:hypothetical protein
MSGKFTPALDAFARHGHDHPPAVTASTLGLGQQAPGSLRTEFVLVHLDRHLSPAATGHSAASDQFQRALAIQLSGVSALKRIPELLKSRVFPEPQVELPRPPNILYRKSLMIGNRSFALRLAARSMGGRLDCIADIIGVKNSPPL